MKPTRTEIVNGFPSLLRRAIAEFCSRYPSGCIDFFVINGIAKYFHDQAIEKSLKRIYPPPLVTRFNYVTHPYIFVGGDQVYDSSINGTFSFTVAHMALYKIDPYDPLYPSEEYQGIPVDPEDFLEEENRIEVHAHGTGREMAISPNNASFLMSTSKPVLSFYSACAFRSSRRVSQLMVCLYLLGKCRHTVWFELELPLTKYLHSLVDRNKMAAVLAELNKNGKVSESVDQMLNKAYVISLGETLSKVNECIRNAFEKGIEEYVAKKDQENALSEALESIGGSLFTSDTEKEKVIGRFFAEEFFDYLRGILVAARHPENFVVEYFKSHSVEYQVELLKKYMRYVMRVFSNTAIHQVKILKQFNSPTIKVKGIEMSEETRASLAARYPESGFFRRHKDKTVNPDLPVLDNYMALMMSFVLSLLTQ